MSFELFDPRRKAPLGRLSKSGAIQFNEAAAKLIGSRRTTNLSFDPERNLIGFPDGDGWKITQNVALIVSIRRLCSTYGIDTSEARSYPVSIEDGVLCVGPVVMLP